MCPAPLYSYFDAQLLADFIMTSQFQEFDTQNSATSGNANQHYDQLSVAATAASLASGYSDYETQDNARLRKRRMTVTDDRRNSLYDYSGSRDAGLFGMNDGYQAGYGQSLAHSSSLPVPPGEGQSIADAITEGMSLSDLAFAGSQQYQVGEMSAGSGGHDGRYSSRRPQSLRVAVTRAQNTESTDPTLATPNMFSPSFMDAMESGSAVGGSMNITSPSVFYNQATSPYVTHDQQHSLYHHNHHHHSHHHHSSSISSNSGYPQSSHMGSGIFSNPSNAADDHLGGLQITMNPMSMSVGGGSSAFSRVNGGKEPSNGHGELNLDIGTTLASFANITGMDGFQTAAAAESPYVHSSSTGFGTMSSEPSFFNPMNQVISGMNPMASPIMSINSPPATAPMPIQQQQRSRKRAATASSSHSVHYHPQTSLQASSSALVSMAPANSLMAPTAYDMPAYNPLALNSQAEVLGSGEKVIMILTSKVAQKSYGTEKRFLCPPPTILLFGDNWQLPVSLPGDNGLLDLGSSPQHMSGRPRITVSVPTNENATAASSDSDEAYSGSSSGEVRAAQIEWLGRPEPNPKAEPRTPREPVPEAGPTRDGEPETGRYVAKQLFINDVDEKRKKVAVKVRLHDQSGQVVLGSFDSKPIKVISKPSKKRQSSKNTDLCIHHGSTISLFNRLRSQTVSTKYLGVSGSMSAGGARPFWFPTGGSDDGSLPPAGPGQRMGGPARSPTFVARTAVWDPFIIWIANTNLTQDQIDEFNASTHTNPTPIPGYPSPPSQAMLPHCPPVFDDASSGGDERGGRVASESPMAIHYNQNVILQCVSTGMVSPILTLRKVEKGSVAVGAHHTNDRFSEVQGDPVSQLHKVAFEVNMSCNADFPPCMMTQDAQGGFVGTYLTCMSDVVGLNKTSDGRQPMSEASPAGNGRKQAKEAAAPAGTTMWAEDVGDTAVWTIVGTDCAIHRFDYPSTAEILERVRNAPAVSAGLPQSQQSQSQQQQQTSAAPSSASRGRRNSRQSASRQYQAQSYYPQQHQQLLHQPMSLDMLVGDSTFAAAAAAAAAIGGTDFAAANSMDSSTFAAAMYGMGLTGIPDTLSNQLLSPQTMSPSSASSSSAHHTADHHHHGGRRNTINIGQLNASHGAGDNSHIPVVFKMSVQHPPSISPSALLENSSGCAERSLVTLHGQNFAPDMTVVFDGQQSVFTEFKSPELIVCFGPLSSDFAATDSPHQHTSSSATDDEGFEDMYARGGEKQRQSPDSDCLPPPSAARSMTTDTLQTLLSDAADSVHHAPHRRASSAESTVSSATVNSSGAERQLAAGGKTESLAKFATRNAGGQAASTIKVPVYLSCGNGAGPTYKTGQFYTLHC